MKNQNRAEVVEKNFLSKVTKGELPAAVSTINPEQCWLSSSKFVDMFESQVMSRLLDIEARELRKTGASYYTIGSSGHEGNVALGEIFKLSDMGFLHYRSGALFIQRQKKNVGSTPLFDILLSIVASSDDPIAKGRHKVWGSLRDLIPPQTSTIASHLPKAVGAALSVNWNQSADMKKVMQPDSVVFCNFGDASANHSTALGAVNHATWWSYRGYDMPLVFICEDNDIGISVPTPENWIASSFAEKPGMKYVYANSLNLCESYAATEAAVHYARTYRKPVFLHLKTIRLLGHAGSDVEGLYHNQEKIDQTEAKDPLLHSAKTILDHNWLSAEEVVNLYNGVKKRVQNIGKEVSLRSKLTDPKIVAESIVPKSLRSVPRKSMDKKLREETFGPLKSKQMQKPQHLAKLLNWALTETLTQYPEAVVFGEDVGKKGGVYHVTAGLKDQFKEHQVFDTLLDEQSILGTAIGMAHNGFIPIPEIQFLAYYHNAQDQIRGEAATLSFFSDEKFTNPMVVRIAGLAYQKGFGGHFHNDNSLSVLRDLPGVVVACPSNGHDAVLMFKECIRQAHLYGRVCVFVEPIALYMTKDLLKEGDGGWSFKYPGAKSQIKVGEFKKYGEGEDCAIISYGNGVYLSRQAQEDLMSEGYDTRLIDLRWLSDIDFDKLSEEVGGSKKILIVDECRRTGSQSEQIATELFERLGHKVTVKRLTADDCFIPLGAGATCVLPSRESIAEAVKSICKKQIEPAREARRVRVREN